MSEASVDRPTTGRSTQRVADGTLHYNIDTGLARTGTDFVRLGEHAVIAKGKPPIQIPYDGVGAAVYLSPDYLRDRAPGVVAKPGADAVLADDGDAVLLWDGSNAGEFFRGKSGIVASTMARLVPSSDFDSSYFVHALKHLEPVLKSRTNGTGIPHVDREVLESCRIFRPRAEIQRAIAQVLDTLDTTIRQTEAIIAKLKQVKQGLLHDLLTRGIDANGELRPPHSEAPHLYKSSPLGWIPKEWASHALGQVLIGRTRNGLYKPSSFHGSGPLMVQMGGMFRGEAVDFQSASRVRVTRPELDAFGVEVGDLLFARRSLTFEGAGQCAIVRNLPEASTFESSIVRARVDRNRVEPEFAALFLRGALSSAHRRTLIRQVAVSGVSGDDIAHFLIALPPLHEQVAIIDAVASDQSRIEHEAANLHKLSLQKSGLMDDLLTGRVRVTPLLEGAATT